MPPKVSPQRIPSRNPLPNENGFPIICLGSGLCSETDHLPRLPFRFCLSVELVDCPDCPVCLTDAAVSRRAATIFAIRALRSSCVSFFHDNRPAFELISLSVPADQTPRTRRRRSVFNPAVLVAFVSQAIRLSRHEALLFGLDAPAKQQVSTAPANFLNPLATKNSDATGIASRHMSRMLSWSFSKSCRAAG